MFKQAKYVCAILAATITSAAFAEDISGTWQQIDDKTGAAKAVIEIHKQTNSTYSGKIIKVTPRPGYTPRETCNKCPAPYTGQPILGMELLKGLKLNEATGNYENGRIIDPLAGKLYNARIKLNASGKRLTLRAYMGVSTIGRNQTWIRMD